MSNDLSETAEFLLWVGFAAMFGSFTIFYAMLRTTAPGKRFFHVLTCAIVGFASTAYLWMALGHGYKLINGRVFHYARYLDWLVTTPLLLLDLSALAGISTEDSLMLVALDVLMVLCGFAGGLSQGNSTLVMWVLGSSFFLPIVFDLTVTFRAKAKMVGAATSACYDKLVVLTVLLWTAYPVVYLLGEYKGIISTTTEIGLYMGLDVSAKCVFGFVLLTSRKALEQDTLELTPSRSPNKESDADSLPLSEPVSKGDASALACLAMNF